MNEELLNFIYLFLKGITLAVLYFEITQTNDTTLSNISYFTLFYILITYGAHVAGIDPDIVTSAFVTKTVFVVIDERVKKQTTIEKN